MGDAVTFSNESIILDGGRKIGDLADDVELK